MFISQLLECWYFGAVMIVGAASLLVTAVWKGLVIGAQIKRDKENALAGVSEEQGPTQHGAQPQEPPVTELATAFVALGVLATTVQVGLVIAQITTGDPYYATATYSLLPIVGVLWVIRLFAQPMRQIVGPCYFSGHISSVLPGSARELTYFLG